MPIIINSAPLLVHNLQIISKMLKPLCYYERINNQRVKREGDAMNKRLMLLDLICYGVIPFLIWNYGRESLGDYIAILLSTVPGFIYTIYRFIKEKQLNIFGLFIITRSEERRVGKESNYKI